METWKTIKDFPLYEISDIGNVRSNHKIGLSKQRNIKLIAHSSGYIVVNLYQPKHDKKVMKQYRVHKLVAEYFVPNPNDYPEINHEDGDKTNNQHTNIKWCDHSYNMQHAYKNHLIVRNKGIRTTKLNPDKVKEIRLRYKYENISQLKLSLEFGVRESTIRNVVNRFSWKFV